ncbi:MAG: fibronectin type III domain-containing protein [Chloroflexi bacterium]|nr:fibronectin type III domain-containing protein [Chloroflexota bacterium]
MSGLERVGAASTHWALHVAVAAILMALVLVPPPAVARPMAGTAADVRISNLMSLSFTVSWVTAEATDGEIRFGPTPALGRVKRDVRRASWNSPGILYRGRIHSIRLTNEDGLAPDTPYYFDVVSGGAVDDDGGRHYTVRTAPIPDWPGIPEQVVGLLREVNCVFVQEAIVFATIVDADGRNSPGESTLQSYLVKPASPDQPHMAGVYQFIWANALESANLRKVFQATPQADRVRYEVVGPGSRLGPLLTSLEVGFSQLQLTLPAAGPTPTPTPTPSSVGPYRSYLPLMFHNRCV